MTILRTKRSLEGKKDHCKAENERTDISVLTVAYLTVFK